MRKRRSGPWFNIHCEIAAPSTWCVRQSAVVITRWARRCPIWLSPQLTLRCGGRGGADRGSVHGARTGRTIQRREEGAESERSAVGEKGAVRAGRRVAPPRGLHGRPRRRGVRQRMARVLPRVLCCLCSPDGRDSESTYSCSRSVHHVLRLRCWSFVPGIQYFVDPTQLFLIDCAC